MGANDDNSQGMSSLELLCMTFSVFSYPTHNWWVTLSLLLYWQSAWTHCYLVLAVVENIHSQDVFKFVLHLSHMYLEMRLCIAFVSVLSCLTSILNSLVSTFSMSSDVEESGFYLRQVKTTTVKILLKCQNTVVSNLLVKLLDVKFTDSNPSMTHW